MFAAVLALERLFWRHVWRLDHTRDADDGDSAPEIVGERGQAEFGADLLQPAHQERALVHPLFDRAERVFDRFPADVQDAGPGGEPPGHALEHRLVLPKVDAPQRPPVQRALMVQAAQAAGLEYWIDTCPRVTER